MHYKKNPPSSFLFTISVFGGKYSKDQNVRPSSSALCILSITFILLLFLFEKERKRKKKKDYGTIYKMMVGEINFRPSLKKQPFLGYDGFFPKELVHRL